MEIENPIPHPMGSGQAINQAPVVVVTPVAGMMLESESVSWAAVGREGSNQFFDEWLHALIVRPQADLRITGDLKRYENIGPAISNFPTNFPFRHLIDVFAYEPTQLCNQT